MGISDHISGNTFESQLNSAILHHKKWLKYQRTPHSAAETAGACQDAAREEGKPKNVSGECGCWAAQAGSGLQAGASGDGYLQLWCGFVLICNSSLPCPRVGAAWLLLSSHQQVRNHQNHSPGCEEGAENTLTALWCPAAPICSPPRAPQAVLLPSTVPVDVLWYKAVGEWMQQRRQISTVLSAKLTLAGHAATTSNLILSCSSSWPPLKNSFSFTWQSCRHVGALPAAELNALSLWVWNNCSG